MFLPRSRRLHISDSVPGLGSAAPLAPGLWSRPFMEPIGFAEGDAELTEDQLRALDDLVVALRWFCTSCIIEVAGHAWGEGTMDELFALARRRAERVSEELIRRGLPRGVVRVHAYGADRPVPTDTVSLSEAVRASRRVELWLHQSTVGSSLPCSDPGAEDCCRSC